jgi:hypothetical protein
MSIAVFFIGVLGKHATSFTKEIGSVLRCLLLLGFEKYPCHTWSEFVYYCTDSGVKTFL